jgi:hypothetical protein
MPHPRRYERDFPHLVEIVVPERGLRTMKMAANIFGGALLILR